MSFYSFNKVGQYGHSVPHPHQRALEDSPSVSFAPCRVVLGASHCLQLDSGLGGTESGQITAKPEFSASVGDPEAGSDKIIFSLLHRPEGQESRSVGLNGVL